MGRWRRTTTFLGEEPRVYPIPIREDVTVRIFGLPADLTAGEANKIAAVVKALATPHPEDSDRGGWAT